MATLGLHLFFHMANTSFAKQTYRIAYAIYRVGTSDNILSAIAYIDKNTSSTAMRSPFPSRGRQRDAEGVLPYEIEISFCIVNFAFRICFSTVNCKI